MLLTRLTGLTLLVLLTCLPAVQAEPPAEPNRFFELYDIAGRLFRLKQFASEEGVKVVAVDFFWDGCEPCKKALPKWQALHDRFKDKGLKVVIVDVRAGDDIATAKRKLKAYFKEHPVSFPVVFDKYNMVAKEYGVVAADNSVSLPQVFLLDPKGRSLLQTPLCKEAEERVIELLTP